MGSFLGEKKKNEKEGNKIRGLLGPATFRLLSETGEMGQKVVKCPQGCYHVVLRWLLTIRECHSEGRRSSGLHKAGSSYKATHIN